MKQYVLMAVMVVAVVMGGRAQELVECGTPYLEAAMERERAQKAKEEQKARMEMEKEQELPPAQAKKGLVLHYSFGKGGQWGPGAEVKDLSGNGHDGKVEGDGLEVVRGIGKRGKAVRFDGKGDYIRVPRNEGVEPEVITVAAWVKFRDGEAGGRDDGIRSVFFKRNTSFHDNEDYCLELHPGHLLRTDLSSPFGGHVKLTTRESLAPELWHHLAITVGGGEARIYVDGKLAVARPHSYPFDHNRQADLLVGARDHASFPMDRYGAFDLFELKIWNKVLKSEQIAALYRARAGRFGVAKPEDNQVPERESQVADISRKNPARPVRPVLHYSFEQGGVWGPGAVVKDLSGNGHDGKVEGDGLEVVRGIGKRGKAVRFDGKGDYIRVPRDAVFEGQEVTVAAWVKLREGDRSAGDEGISVLVFKRNTSFHCNEHYCFEIFPNHVLRATVGYPPMAQARVDMAMPLTTEFWHHVAMTFRDGIIRVYLDGEEVGKGYFPHQLNCNCNADLLVGVRDHEGYPLSRFGAFDLAELKIWNEALDAERVSVLYKKLEGRKGVASSKMARNKKEGANAGLVLHYSFGMGGEWGPGTMVKDLSGNGHDGTVEGDGLEVVRGIGKRGKAVRFDGEGDYIRVPRDAALEPQEITVAAWVRMRESHRSAGEDGIGVLVFKRNTSFHDNEDYCCEIHPNHMPQAEIANPRGMHSRVPAGMAMAPDLWHHVVLTVGGGEIRFYLDGKQTVSRSHPYPQDHNTGADLFVGTRDHAGYPLSHFGAFDLAELEIWNEVLDGGRVESLYRKRARHLGVATPEDNRAPWVEKPMAMPPKRTLPRVFPPWTPGLDRREMALASELRTLVSQGRRDRAASPEFLGALEGLLEKYGGKGDGNEEKPSGKLPLKPDFKGPGMPPGWSAVNPAVWQFGDGEARQVESRANTRYVLFYEPGKAWRDYAVRVRFESDKWFPPPANSCAAVWVRYKGVDDAYCVHFDGNGNVSVISCEQGGKGRVIVRTAAGPEVVKDGKPWTVRVRGEEMVVEHEGRRYLEVHDGTHREGTVGVESIHIPMKFSDVQVK